MSTLFQFFVPRLAGRDYYEKFEAIAHTITKEYIEDIYKFANDNGYPPGFPYVYEKVGLLSNELTMRAKWMRDEYKEGRGGRASITLTTGCKRIIKSCVAEYLQSTKNLKKMIDSSGGKVYG